MNDSVVNSAGESFCWNYATDTFMAIMQVTTSVEFMQVSRWYFVNGMLVDLSVAIMQVTVSVAIMQLEVSAAHMQVTVSAAKIWLTIFVVIMQMGVSAAIMQVVFSAVHYAHDCFCCNCAGESFFYSHVGDSFKL